MNRNTLRVAANLRRAAVHLESGHLCEALHLVIVALQAIWKETVRQNVLNPDSARKNTTFSLQGTGTGVIEEVKWLNKIQ